MKYCQGKIVAKVCICLFLFGSFVGVKQAKAADFAGVVTSAALPLENVCVYLFTGDSGCEMESTEKVSTDATGTYTITVDGSQQYFVKTQASCNPDLSNFIDEYWDGGAGSSSCDQAISIASGSNLNFDLEMGVELSGTLSDTNGPLSMSTNYLGATAYTGNPCENHEYVGSSSIDTNGKYTILLPPTSDLFYVKTSANNAGFVDQWYAGINSTDGTLISSYNCSDAQSVSIGLDPSIENIDFTLAQGGSIQGKITAVDGTTPIENAWVTIITGSPCDHNQTVGTSTDSNGDYVLNGIPITDNLSLRVRDDSDIYQQAWYAGVADSNALSDPDCNNAVSLDMNNLPDTGGSFNLEMAVGGTISGTVSTLIDDVVSAVSGEDSDMNVAVYTGEACDDFEWEGGSAVQSDGTYSVGALDTDTQYLVRSESNGAPYLDEWFSGFDTEGNPTSSQDCDDAEKIIFEEGTTSQAQVDIEVDQAALIKGTVTGLDLTTYVTGACITVYTDACDDNDTARVAGEKTDDNGDYTVAVPAGAKYHIEVDPDCSDNQDVVYVSEFWHSDGGDSNCSSAEYTDTTSLTTAVEGIDFQLEEGGDISGTLYEEGVVINGNKNQMGVAIYTGSPCDDYDRVGDDSIDENGSYTVGGLSLSGTFYARTYSDGAPYERRWFAGFDNSDPENLIPKMSDDCNEAAELTFEELSTEITGIDFDYEKSALIQGTVMGYDNTLLQDACVYAFSEASGEWDDILAGETQTDEDGTYTLPVPEGSGYYIYVKPSCSEDQTANLSAYWTGDEVTTDSDFAVKTEEVSVDTPITGIDFTLNEGAIITGNVTTLDEDSITQPVDDICVNVWTGSICDEIDYVNNGHTDEDGDYSVVVPFEQEYYLQTQVNCGDNQLIDKYWSGSENDGTYLCGEASVVQPIQGGDAITADFILASGVTISGTVTSQSSGETVGDIKVRAQLNKCENSSSLSQAYSSTEDSDKGSYSLLVPQGVPVYLQTCVNCGDSDSGSGYMDIWYPGVSESNCQDADSVEGPVTGVNLALPQDTDGDELSDYDEINVYGTDPTLIDSDGDGLDDSGEVYLWGDDFAGDIDEDGLSNIEDDDADGDGITDVQELARGTSMKDPLDTPADLTLYDDFFSTSLDADKWKDPSQFVREVESGTLHLSLEGSGTFSNSVIMNSTSAQKIRTTVRLNEATVYGDESSAYLNAGGRFYNITDNSSALTGQVRAAISIGYFGEGLAVRYWIGTTINENDEYETFVSDYIISATANELSLDTDYHLEINYDGENNFIFTIYDVPATDSETATVLGTANIIGPSFGTSIEASRWLQVMTRDSGGIIDVTVDSVEVAADDTQDYVMYDDFNETTLSSDNWIWPEAVRVLTDDEELRIVSHSFGDKETVRAVMKERYSYVETKVKFSSQSTIEGLESETELRARLSGTLYNVSRGPGSGLSYNGAEGDVWAQVVIQYTEDEGLTAYGSVERSTDANWDSYEKIISDPLNIQINYDTEYILYIGFTGDYIIIGIDSADGTQHAMIGDTIETPKYLPYDRDMELISRVKGEGNAGLTEVYFDDVKVAGEPLEKAGDLNVDSNVDLQDVILGLQNLTGGASNQVWAAGDTNGDDVIGIPDVIGILKEISQ